MQPCMSYIAVPRVQLMALNGRADTHQICPVLKVDRPRHRAAVTSQFDPNRTLGAAFCCDARPPPQLDLLYLAVILASGEPYEASRSHYPARRCSRVAACGARAAAEIADRGDFGRGDGCNVEHMDARLRTPARGARLDRRPHRRDRISLG